MRIHHVALRVQDLDAARAFYGELLGLPELKRDGARSVWLRAGDAVLMLEQNLRGKGHDEGSGHVLALAVDDLASWEEKLTLAGVAIEDRTEHTIFVRDPDGHRVGLSVFELLATDEL